MNSCREHLPHLISHWQDHIQMKEDAKMLLIEEVDAREAFHSTRKCHKARCRSNVLFKLSWNKKEIRSRIRR